MEKKRDLKYEKMKKKFMKFLRKNYIYPYKGCDFPLDSAMYCFREFFDNKVKEPISGKSYLLKQGLWCLGQFLRYKNYKFF